jgi:predicted kinase
MTAACRAWLATKLAPRLRAIHLRSDVERKPGAGLAPNARANSGPGRGLYVPEVTAGVYA